MIDITLRLEKENKAWEWLRNQENKLINAGHLGTHIDVYKKTQVPIEYFKSNGIFVDCSEYELDQEIGLESLKDIEIKKESFIIFKTNIQNKYPYGDKVYISNHNQVSWELIDFLIEQNIFFIGIDCAGIRRGKEHVEADIKSELNKTYIIENLDLSKLNLNRNEIFDVYTMWIENPFATGLSTRVLVDVKF